MLAKQPAADDGERVFVRPLGLWRVAGHHERAIDRRFALERLEKRFELGLRLGRRAEMCGTGMKPSWRNLAAIATRAGKSSLGRNVMAILVPGGMAAAASSSARMSLAVTSNE
jgi:hypothetical protein